MSSSAQKKKLRTVVQTTVYLSPEIMVSLQERAENVIAFNEIGLCREWSEHTPEEIRCSLEPIEQGQGIRNQNYTLEGYAPEKVVGVAAADIFCNIKFAPPKHHSVAGLLPLHQDRKDGDVKYRLIITVELIV